MGNIGVSIKRFLGNKNTVTIIGVLAGLAILYIGYNTQINRAIAPVAVPYAKQTIPGNTEIKTEMVGSIKVSKNMVDTLVDLVRHNTEVIGKYAKYDTTITEGSLFYRAQLMAAEETPNFIFRDIPKGYTVYSLPVNLHSTYGNSIMPKDYIDLYFKAVDDNNYIMFGKFIESIQVLTVKDSSGHHVFSSSSNGNPAELIFAVPDDYFLLLRKAGYIRTNSIEIVPVPRNQDYTDKPGETQITSEEIKAFINAKAIDARQNEGTDIILPGEE